MKNDRAKLNSGTVHSNMYDQSLHTIHGIIRNSHILKLELIQKAKTLVPISFKWAYVKGPILLKSLYKEYKGM